MGELPRRVILLPQHVKMNGVKLTMPYPSPEKFGRSRWNTKFTVEDRFDHNVSSKSTCLQLPLFGLRGAPLTEKYGAVKFDALFFNGRGTFHADPVGSIFDALEGPFNSFKLHVAPPVLLKRHRLLLHAVHSREASDARLIQFDWCYGLRCGFFFCQETNAQRFHAIARPNQFDFVHASVRMS
jgi:hypothetical protein